MPYLAKGHRPDINNGPGVTRIVPTFWPQHLFKLNSNNGPSPGHSILGSDGRYTCSSLLFMDSWWMPYLPKDCRSDFNNGLGGDSNSGPVLPLRLFDSDSNNGPSLGHSNLVPDGVYISVQVSYLWFPGGYNDFSTDVSKQIRLCLHLHETFRWTWTCWRRWVSQHNKAKTLQMGHVQGWTSLGQSTQ